MIELVVELFFTLFGAGLIYYTYTVCLVYLSLVVLAVIEMIEYKAKNGYVNYSQILSSPFTPSITIIAPAYNESASIVENINSLMSLYYNNYEVIVVNDGSKDDTLQKVIEHFHLEKVDFFIDYQIPCQEIIGVYKSSVLSKINLTVVDKINGGKADALNAGINISKKSLISCIDVDCILERDCLLKMVKPFLDKGSKVVATGGTIRIVNDSQVKRGRVIESLVPKKLIPRFQVNEYLRAFLIGRMAWSHVNGLLLVSGALGLFDRKLVVEAGGYHTDTVGEDMELVVRLRKLMYTKKIPARVVYVPEPLCWTEVPSSLDVLGRQRNRWTRGSIETLLSHADLLFNRRFGILGMLSYPAWVLTEWLAPFVESIGLLYLFLLALLGYMSILKVAILVLFIVIFSLFMTSMAIILEERGYPIYNHRYEIYRLLILSVIEPFVYHPYTIFWALRGNIDYLRGVKSWGAISRTGFSKDGQKK